MAQAERLSQKTIDYLFSLIIENNFWKKESGENETVRYLVRVNILILFIDLRTWQVLKLHLCLPFTDLSQAVPGNMHHTLFHNTKYGADHNCKVELGIKLCTWAEAPIDSAGLISKRHTSKTVYLHGCVHRKSPNHRMKHVNSIKILLNNTHYKQEIF